MNSVISFKSCFRSLLLLASLTVAANSQTKHEWIDISAPLSDNTPVFPGDAPIRLDFLKQLKDGDPVTLSKFDMGAHSGTHVDAPLHFIPGGKTIDQISISRFIGPVRVIDCSPEALAIDASELNKHQWRGAQRIFFRTRNSSNRWMRDKQFHPDFTYVAPDAAQLLAEAGVQLVGIDYISMEKFKAEQPLTHRMLLGRDIPIVEGLDLSDVRPGDYELMLLPIRIVGHEAAPARALIRKP